MESKTPICDRWEYDSYSGGLVVPINVAKDLEIELAEARAENMRLAKTMQLAIAINLAMQESSYDMPDLRGHECLAKHKLLSLFDLWRKKVRPRLPGFVDDEISKRDKLIEQMREQIIAAIKEAGRHFAVGDTIEILHAALKVAEMGER